MIKATVAAIILGSLILWVCLDFYWGRKKYLQKKTARSYPVRSSEIEVYCSGKDLFSGLFQEIDAASSHIHILFYIVKYDHFSQGFLTMLERKACEGVEVRLLVDWLGGHKIPRKRIKDLKQKGVQFAFSGKPRFPFLFYTLQKRNHRKIAVIDGELGYIGGYNIGKEYIDMDPKLHPWRDYHLKISGEGVKDLQTEFLHDWRAAVHEDLLGKPAFYPPLDKGPTRHQIAPTSGRGLEETLIRMFRSAETSIIIGTPYFIPSSSIFDELQRVLARGIKLTIIVPKKSDHALVKEASYRYFRILEKQGAAVLQFKKGFYHSKVMVVDDQICDIGTANLDKRSLFLNREINCLIYDPDCIRFVKEKLQEDQAASEPMPRHLLYQKNIFRSMKEAIAFSLSPFL